MAYKTKLLPVKTIEDAIALFRVGKSLRECEQETGISKSTIDREAKKQGLTRGDLGHLSRSIANDKILLSQISEKTGTVVLNLADQITSHILFFNDATMKNCSIMMKKVCDDMGLYEHRIVQETLSKAKETVVGKMLDTAIQVNNNNQQVGAITRTYVEAD